MIQSKNLDVKNFDESHQSKVEDNLCDLCDNKKDKIALASNQEKGTKSKKGGSTIEFLKRKRNPK